MHAPLAFETPLFLTARRLPSAGGRQRLVVAVVVGEGGTTCSATASSIRDAAVSAQETYWRATAEGAYQ